MTTTNNRIKKSYRDINAFLRGAQEWMARHPEQTKFRYALKRVVDRCNRVMENYRAEIDDINIKFAAVDDKKVLITDDRGQFRYERDDLIKRNKEQREIFDREAEVEPYYATELVPLTVDEIDVFQDFVFQEPPEPTAPPKPPDAPA